MQKEEHARQSKFCRRSTLVLDRALLHRRARERVSSCQGSGLLPHSERSPRQAPPMCMVPRLWQRWATSFLDQLIATLLPLPSARAKHRLPKPRVSPNPSLLRVPCQSRLNRLIRPRMLKPRLFGTTRTGNWSVEALGYRVWNAQPRTELRKDGESPIWIRKRRHWRQRMVDQFSDASNCYTQQPLFTS
jgi:hypothetical protein